MAWIPEYFLSKNECEKKTDVCYDCDESVKRDPATGRWFITIGHPGFNSGLNNNRGYRTRRLAMNVVKFCGRRK